MKLKDEIAYELIKFLNIKPTAINIPNFYYGGFEMDIFSLTFRNDIITEYEIKTTKADYKNDFKKNYTAYNRKKKIYETHHKHKTEYKANKFYFVVPDGLIKPDEIPDKLGLIYYYPEKNVKFKIIKKAFKLNDNKVNTEDYKNISIKLSYREFQWRLKYEKGKTENITELKKQLKSQEKLFLKETEKYTKEINNLHKVIFELKHEIRDEKKKK